MDELCVDEELPLMHYLNFGAGSFNFYIKLTALFGSLTGLALALQESWPAREYTDVEQPPVPHIYSCHDSSVEPFQLPSFCAVHRAG